MYLDGVISIQQYATSLFLLVIASIISRSSNICSQTMIFTKKKKDSKRQYQKCPRGFANMVSESGKSPLKGRVKHHKIDVRPLERAMTIKAVVDTIGSHPFGSFHRKSMQLWWKLGHFAPDTTKEVTSLDENGLDLSRSLIAASMCMQELQMSGKDNG